MLVNRSARLPLIPSHCFCTNEKNDFICCFCPLRLLTSSFAVAIWNCGQRGAMGLAFLSRRDTATFSGRRFFCAPISAQSARSKKVYHWRGTYKSHKMIGHGKRRKKRRFAQKIKIYGCCAWAKQWALDNGHKLARLSPNMLRHGWRRGWLAEDGNYGRK